MLFCLTAVDTEMLFEVVFVLEGFPTLQTFELPVLHGLIQSDSTLGREDIVINVVITLIYMKKKLDIVAISPCLLQY